MTSDIQMPRVSFDTGWVAEEDEITGIAITDLGTGKPVPLALVAGRVDALIDAYLKATPPDRDADV